jgi:hypothetical protein
MEVVFFTDIIIRDIGLNLFKKPCQTTVIGFEEYVTFTFEIVLLKEFI